MNEKLKENVIYFTKKKNYSYRQLERDAGLHKNFLSNFLSSDKTPKIDAITKLADTLEVSIDELIGRDGWSIKESEDFTIDNFELLEELLNYYIANIGSLHKTLSANALLKSMREIYKFSAENNNGKLDQKFAKWYLENNFKISQ